MALVNWLKGRTKGVEEFVKIIKDLAPNQNELSTLSGNKLQEYTMYVPYGLNNSKHASSVGTAFDYLARFRIARVLKDEKAIDSLVAGKGFYRVMTSPQHKEAHLTPQHYTDMLKPASSYIIGESQDTLDSLIPLSLRLAHLEDVARGSLKPEQVNVDKLFSTSSKEDVRNELIGLLSVFEEKFMVPEIINEKSNVIYNPDFGLSSLLVGGADADIFIDGILYDFKTSKNKGYSLVDSSQLIGYYLLNELSQKLSSISFELPDYEGLEIKKVALYKGRFGELEYYDLDNLATIYKNDAVQKMAAYFAGNITKLGLFIPFYINELDYALE